MKYKYATLSLFCGILLLGCTKKEEIIALEQSLLKGQPYTLEIWTAQDGDFIKALGQEFVSTINEPGLSVAVVDFPNEDVLHDFLLDKLGENKGPDMVFTRASWIRENQDKFHPQLGNTLFNAQTFRDQLLPAGQILVDGEVIWGIPIGIETLGIIYNEELFIKGFKDQIKPSQDWNGFQADVKTLRKPNTSFERFAVAGAALGLPDNVQHGFWTLQNLFHQLGAQMFSGDLKEAVFASLNILDEAGDRQNLAQNALGFLVSFSDSRHPNFTWNQELAAASSNTKEYEGFLEGEIAMIIGSARDYKNLVELSKKESKIVSESMIRVASFPQFNPSNEKSVAKTWSLGVLGSAKNYEVAQRFALFALSPENLLSYFQATGIPGSRKSTYLEQAADINLGPFVKPILYAESVLYPIEIESFITEAWKKVQERKLSISKALQDAEKAINENLKEKIVLENKINIVKQKKQAPQ